MDFNTKASTLMHIDLNSCFATIEQQANRQLRGRPIAVAAYNSPGGCILASSIEAKRLGVKTGMRVQEGKLLCPDLLILEPDPAKYRCVHLQFREIINCYTPKFSPKSIDEFALNLEGCPAFKLGMHEVAKRIKCDIKNAIGDYITVSIGIAPNRFLAKAASVLHKPDGLDEIHAYNFKEIYAGLKLQDLCGIAANSTARLAESGIYTVMDFYNAKASDLIRAFHSIGGYYWYLRLRGWEIDAVDFARKSFGNSYALPKPFWKLEDLLPILQKLTEKMCFRLHTSGFKARGVGVAVRYKTGNFWHKTRLYADFIYKPGDFFTSAFKLLGLAPYKEPVHTLTVFCFGLIKTDTFQPDLFGVEEKNYKLADAVDAINAKWGNFVLGPASILLSKDLVKDRIAFGGVRELT